MNKKKIYFLIAIAFVFFIIVLIIFFKSSCYSGKKDLELSKEEVQEKVEQIKPVKVKMFFLQRNSRYMKPFSYEIGIFKTRQDLYKAFINELLKSREDCITPIPEGLKLRSVFYVKKRKILIVDFNEVLLNKFPVGTSSELEFIYYFVDNICYNFKEIEEVKFLVSGNEYKTISGHIDIENPFYPDYRYLRDE